MLSKRLTEVDVSTILTILQCTCSDNLFLVFPVLGPNYIVVSKILLVCFMDFPKLLVSMRIYASCTVGSFHLLVKRKMTKNAL